MYQALRNPAFRFIPKSDSIVPLDSSLLQLKNFTFTGGNFFLTSTHLKEQNLNKQVRLCPDVSVNGYYDAIISNGPSYFEYVYASASATSFRRSHSSSFSDRSHVQIAIDELLIAFFRSLSQTSFLLLKNVFQLLDHIEH